MPFLPERKETKKAEKLVTNLNDKNENVIHIRNLKQALNHELILKKVHRVSKLYWNIKIKLALYWYDY